MSDEKTEPPTQKKIDDARKKGQVANSKDVTSAALLVGLFSCVSALWVGMIQDLKGLLMMALQFVPDPSIDATGAMLKATILKISTLTLPFLGVVLVIGIAANYFQVGPLMAFEGLIPDLNKLNPVDKLKQMFGVKNWVEFLKSCLKVTFLGVLVFYVVRDAIDPLLKIPYTGLASILDLLPQILKTFSQQIMWGYVVLAAFDLFFQRYQYTEGLKMTKDEVKREYKEMEGDPLIKSQRRHLHEELLTENTMETVKKSTAMVTNPTHVAIALLYDEQKVPLPVLTAKGEGPIAQRMMKAAREAKVPIVENVWLARSLYQEVPPNHYIPREFIPAVAEVLKWVREQKEKGNL